MDNPLAHGRLDRRVKNLQRVAFLRHVVVPVVVPRLHAGETMRLEMPPNLAADVARCQQRLHTGPNSLELKARDRPTPLNVEA